jgi:hypothetical protein
MLSDEKITHLTHVLLKKLLDRDLIDVTEEEGTVRKSIKRAVQAQLSIGHEMEDTVRRKIQSLSRNVAEGSPEWETLYQKYFQEEEVKRGMAG